MAVATRDPALPVDRDLPAPTEEFRQFASTAEADWFDPDSLVEHPVNHARVLVGGERSFDEEAVRNLVRRDMLRARDFASVKNHDSIPDDDRQHAALASISVPTLVDPRHL